MTWAACGKLTLPKGTFFFRDPAVTEDAARQAIPDTRIGPTVLPFPRCSPERLLGRLHQLRGIDDIVHPVAVLDEIVIILGILDRLRHPAAGFRLRGRLCRRDLLQQILLTIPHYSLPPLDHPIGEPAVTFPARPLRRRPRSPLVAHVAIHIDNRHPVGPVGHKPGPFAHIHRHLGLMFAALVAPGTCLRRLPPVMESRDLVLDGRMAGEAFDLMVGDVIPVKELRRVSGLQDLPLVVALEAGKFRYVPVAGDHVRVAPRALYPIYLL